MAKLIRRHIINTVFTRDVGQLRRILIGMGMAAHEGEDILQDVYQEALARPPQDRGQKSLRHWLRRVTVNRALLQFRRKRIQQRVLEAMPKDQRPEVLEPHRQVVVDEETRILRECLAQIPEPFRIPLVLRYCCDWNATEIGQILDLKPGTVRKRLFEARVQLAKLLTTRGVIS